MTQTNKEAITTMLDSLITVHEELCEKDSPSQELHRVLTGEQNGIPEDIVKRAETAIKNCLLRRQLEATMHNWMAGKLDEEDLKKQYAAVGNKVGGQIGNAAASQDLYNQAEFEAMKRANLISHLNKHNQAYKHEIYNQAASRMQSPFNPAGPNDAQSIAPPNTIGGTLKGLIGL